VLHPVQQWPAKPLKTIGCNQAIPIPRDLALLLSASVKTYPSEMMVTNGLGTDRCAPCIIERAIPDARDSIDGLPEGFSFHDLRHYLASPLFASGADKDGAGTDARHQRAHHARHLRSPMARRW
jgi:integrase